MTKAQNKDIGNKPPALSHVLSLTAPGSINNVLRNFTSISVVLNWVGGVIFTSWGTFDNVWNILLVTTGAGSGTERKVLLTSSGSRPRMLLNTLHCTRQQRIIQPKMSVCRD